ncbi:fumarate reductase (quinol) flavoprotein subunit [Planosporangium flavigriseum]|uniref:Fumarate reductase flavoprotein subunit n=1 Tax=Planosporangium flavigriseum TaxID=373681 RepID=A0A8J3LLV1_9ACTN|nr:fumarate reductase (quinol) flavoprotein subunit [Planosporangium flavigriseum]NJC66069.1 fumarate reductase (quinol) flavoprotein subunit [Planosporangium flavigriseum]GIG75102.1 fumarate reductase flavoprotein subunit [Planosporangium flavigriseum]
MTIRHDVVIAGGGGAGLRAAIAIAEARPDLSIATISKVYPMRSHTVSAEGGAAAVKLPADSLDEHAHDTISGGDWLCDQDAVEAFVAEAPEELLRLEHWGCPWSREPDGQVAVRAFGGMRQRRTWFAADKTGFHLLHTLFQTSLKYPSIVRYDEWFITRVLVDDGRVGGVVAIELMSGRIETITAGAVIVCTGGCGRVYPFTTNANTSTGDGMALAFRAGAPLKDMEFVQYHPTGLPFTGILISEAARAEGGWLVNRDGYRYLQDYNLGRPAPGPVLRSMELGPRDRLSQAFVKEVEKGRAIDTPWGPVVHLDLRHLGEEVIEARLPFVRELCLDYEHIDPVRELIPVRPVVHYMMGGVDTDLHGATPLDGLYAAGETACVSINGANRLGSNSLPELLVFGARAGAAVAEAAEGRRAPGPAVLAQGQDERRHLERDLLQRDRGRERIAAVREEMQQTVEQGAGIYRSGDSLTKAADKLHELQERCGSVAIDDHSRVFNTELTAALELSFMLDVAQSVVRCAWLRQESRGAHQRIDFPTRDDERYLAHSLIHLAEDGEPEVRYRPVTITRWPPAERVYGR